MPECDASVLDLGCGDGALLEQLIDRGLRRDAVVGVDISGGELALARSRPALAGVGLVRARAQRLPLAPASVDWVLSHLAFMLMDDIEAVVAEIGRVLGPGGRFAAVVGGGPDPGAEDGFTLFLDRLRAEYAGAEAPIPRLGDLRARHGDGLATLMTGIVEDTAHELRLDGTPEEVWGTLATSYEVAALDAAALERLRREFLDAARERAGDAGILPCVMRLRLLTCARQP